MTFDDIRRAVDNLSPVVDREQWNHTKETRLAILCGAGTPTPEYLEMAENEADDEQKKLNKP